MKTKEFLKKHSACIDGAKWALSISKDMADVWEAMIKEGRYEWMLWTATKPGVLSDSVLRKMACRFIRETPIADGRKVWDLLTDERSRIAIEVAERYADGKATAQELDAAHDDAYAAHAAARAAAYAAEAADRDAADVAAYDADFAAHAAYDAARAAAYAAAACVAYAAHAAARATEAAAHAAAYAVYDADAARAAASAAAKEAQVRMISELGNPFKEERA